MYYHAANFTDAAANALEPEITPPSDAKKEQVPVVKRSDATGESNKKSKSLKLRLIARAPVEDLDGRTGKG